MKIRDYHSKSRTTEDWYELVTILKWAVIITIAGTAYGLCHLYDKLTTLMRRKLS